MSESREAVRNLLGGVARIRPARWIQAVLHHKISKIEIALRATADAEERIGRVLIADIAVSIRGMRLKSFVDRPAKVQTPAGCHVQVFKIVQSHISDVEHTGICLGRIVTPGPRTQRHAVRIAQAEGPNARSRRARVCRVKERIADEAVASFRVNANDLAAQ
jgi:hypothetical protein